MQKYIILIFLLFGIFAYGSNKNSNLPLLQAGISKYWCPITGENLILNKNTNYTAQLQNGTQRQYSSYYGLYFDISEYGIIKNSAKKFDTNLNRFTPINTDNINYTKEDFLNQTKYIENIKTKKLYKMGEKIYKQKCKNSAIELDNFLEINELKGYLVKLSICGNINEDYLHPLSIYLWDIKKNGLSENKNIINVGEDEKCPVCGMFAHKYPKWVAKLHYGDKQFAFDGVKDLMKFYFNPKKWGKYERFGKDKITSFEVTDYYLQTSIDGFKAFYVIRSDIYGPMGHELIPFYKLEDAKVFAKDHRGKQILNFREINENLPYELDKN